MKFSLYDKSINRIETENGTLTLSSLFFPFFIELVLISMIGTVNTIFLSHSSETAVAAVGSCSQLNNMVQTFYSVVSSGASIVISQNLGAGNRKRASDAALISILFSIVLSIFIGTIMSVFAGTILTKMNLTGEVLKQATSYFRIYISFSFISAITSALSGILRSYGLPKVAVKVSIFVNTINASLCYIVVYRPFETPLHGVTGIATGSVISFSCGLILMIILFSRASLQIRFTREILQHLELIGPILRIGVPGGISNVSYSLSQVVSTAIIATLGVTAITTKVYVENIFFYIYVVGLALGNCTAIMISRLAGARLYDQAYRLNRQNLRITIFTNIAISLCINIFGGYIIRIFTDNPEIINIARLIMMIDLFVEIGRGFNHIENNSLRGAGDVVFPMAVSITSCWVVSILFSYILGIKLGLGLFGCWIAFAMDELFRGILFFLRWKSGKWTAKTLV
jgi:putative MATE family efflux protein